MNSKDTKTFSVFLYLLLVVGFLAINVPTSVATPPTDVASTSISSTSTGVGCTTTTNIFKRWYCSIKSSCSCGLRTSASVARTSTDVARSSIDRSSITLATSSLARKSPELASYPIGEPDPADLVTRYSYNPSRVIVNNRPYSVNDLYIKLEDGSTILNPVKAQYLKNSVRLLHPLETVEGIDIPKELTKNLEAINSRPTANTHRPGEPMLNAGYLIPSLYNGTEIAYKTQDTCLYAIRLDKLTDKEANTLLLTQDYKLITGERYDEIIRQCRWKEIARALRAERSGRGR